jgi:HEAT repeat protein
MSDDDETRRRLVHQLTRELTVACAVIRAYGEAPAGVRDVLLPFASGGIAPEALMETLLQCSPEELERARSRLAAAMATEADRHAGEVLAEVRDEMDARVIETLTSGIELADVAFVVVDPACPYVPRALSAGGTVQRHRRAALAEQLASICERAGRELGKRGVNDRVDVVLLVYGRVLVWHGQVPPLSRGGRA